jgi:hypothetical protein
MKYTVTETMFSDIFSNGEYLAGEPISSDWLDILEAIENTLNNE